MVKHRLPTEDEIVKLPRIELTSQDKWSPSDHFDRLPLSGVFQGDTNGTNGGNVNQSTTFMFNDHPVFSTSVLPNDCDSDPVHDRLSYQRQVRSPPDRSSSFGRSNGQQNHIATLSLSEVTQSMMKNNATLWMMGERPGPVLEVTLYKPYLLKYADEGPG